MKRIFSIVTLLFTMSFSNGLFAQAKTITISGKVISFEESLALEGVSISVKGTKNNTGTQADGTFSLAVTGEHTVLVFELKDYETQEVTLNGKREYDIVLKRVNGTAALGH